MSKGVQIHMALSLDILLKEGWYDLGKECGKQVGDPHRLIGTAGCETCMPSGVRGVGESFPYSILRSSRVSKKRERNGFSFAPIALTMNNLELMEKT